MDINDMILVSIDDHLIEPADMFDRHTPEKFKGRMPKMVRTDNGLDQWQWEGMAVGTTGLSAVVSWPSEEWGFDPTGVAEMRPGCYDIHERIRDMDANGIFASMNFPTFAGFAGTQLHTIKDDELRAAVVSSYNDWHVDEWCGAYPGRMLPQGIGDLWNVGNIVSEIHRLGKKGVRAFSFPETPYVLGLPNFMTEHWDPMFAALCDHDMVLNLHIGIAFNLLQQPEGYPKDHLILLAPQLSAITATDLLVAGVFRRFPDLKIGLSEGGVGWIPFYLDRVERHLSNHTWTGLDIGHEGMSATEIFRKHFIGCFITDPSALSQRNRIGIDSIAWECDYPHSDCTWPNSPEMVFAEFEGAGLSDEEINKITYANVGRFYGLDLFKDIPKEQATVGALRALATDVDTSTTSKAEYRRRYEAAQLA
jgi:predicted TIM-barrel fold metal-dependent hydrolase